MADAGSANIPQADLEHIEIAESVRSRAAPALTATSVYAARTPRAKKPRIVRCGAFLFGAESCSFEPLRAAIPYADPGACEILRGSFADGPNVAGRAPC